MQCSMLPIIGFLVGQITCETPPPADTFCQNAEPIEWHANDTRKTKEQIDRLNAKGKRICGWRKRQ